MPLRFGDIVDLHANTVDGGKKFKIAVCVEPNEWWFFYINTKKYSFASSSTMEIRCEDLSRLKYTSYLNLYSLCKSTTDEIQSIDTSKIYRFNNPSLYKTMMYIIETSNSLTPE